MTATATTDSFPADQRDALVTPAQVAAYRRTSVGTLAAERHHGRGPRYVKVGRRVLYVVGDVLDWVDSCAVTPHSRP